ncbi:MAG: HipA N-terminal domain-containing protein [Clostridium sp.]|nr:HipA N-terminal domain-containing protein [Clostridium sp.]
MRRCRVFINGTEAGILTEHEHPRAYSFRYHETYVDMALPPVSLTMPLRREEYRAPVLFPYFFNLLSEGENRALQSALHHIDREDDFGILLATAQHDTVGAVTVDPIND